MSDFTVFDIKFPRSAQKRVIVNTDAKNECDDQFAIVQAILTPSFELCGVSPAHFGDKKSKTSLQDSVDGTNLLLRLMKLEGKVRVEPGAAGGARVAGGQDYEVRYEADKSGVSKDAVKGAVKEAGNSRKNVEAELDRK